MVFKCEQNKNETVCAEDGATVAESPVKHATGDSRASTLNTAFISGLSTESDVNAISDGGSWQVYSPASGPNQASYCTYISKQPETEMTVQYSVLKLTSASQLPNEIEKKPSCIILLFPTIHSIYCNMMYPH